MTKGLVQSVEIISKLLMWVACFVGFLMMMHITLDVAGRVLFNHPIEGTIEVVSGYYMVVVAFLPLAYIASHEGHIIVELFTRGLSERKLLRLDTAVDVVAFAYMTLFTWETAVVAIEETKVGEVWETASDFILIWPSRWLLPVGCGLMAAFLLMRVVRTLRDGSRG